MQLQLLYNRLSSRKIMLSLSDAAQKWLADEGYDPVFGARPLKRVIQRALQDPLAEMILAGDISEGETLAVDASTDGLIIGDRLSQSNQKASDQTVLH